MPNLRTALIQLAHHNPKIRKDLLPLLRSASHQSGGRGDQNLQWRSLQRGDPQEGLLWMDAMAERIINRLGQAHIFLTGNLRKPSNYKITDTSIFLKLEAENKSLDQVKSHITRCLYETPNLHPKIKEIGDGVFEVLIVSKSPRTYRPPPQVEKLGSYYDAAVQQLYTAAEGLLEPLSQQVDTPERAKAIKQVQMVKDLLDSIRHDSFKVKNYTREVDMLTEKQVTQEFQRL